ncbi:hypothetical protein JHK82_027857 [Glycine max]|uniref:Uncharacterized protein n=2 Tax=Glycine subgen. Soja TaxID=1462606 RepID=K7LIX2_SOYBN|nr:hypothetical protein JHK87_027762 [Glycine soja]KAG4997085.1 hypothetical protein JHK85_028524 [Glycine max]KAG5003853.1 hypothetical protein JHK86_027992 [Glycine max]KAG5127022.1 hypothetical protein JHK82_027857 [Glycine max]KAG5151637.1 hypothetical protein JHK84_028109 [Glycine max]
MILLQGSFNLRKESSTLHIPSHPTRSSTFLPLVISHHLPITLCSYPTHAQTPPPPHNHLPSSHQVLGSQGTGVASDRKCDPPGGISLLPHGGYPQ